MGVTGSEETPKKEPVAPSGGAEGEADTSAAAVAEATAAVADTEASAPSSSAPTAAAASSSSPPASPSATTSPPMTPQHQLNAASVDQMTNSVVRCLAFANTFVMSGLSVLLLLIF